MVAKAQKASQDQESENSYHSLSGSEKQAGEENEQEARRDQVEQDQREAIFVVGRAVNGSPAVRALRGPVGNGFAAIRAGFQSRRRRVHDGFRGTAGRGTLAGFFVRPFSIKWMNGELLFAFRANPGTSQIFPLHFSHGATMGALVTHDAVVS